jgi:hypothetical protein
LLALSRMQDEVGIPLGSRQTCFVAGSIHRTSLPVSGTFATYLAHQKPSCTRAIRSSNLHRRVTNCQRRPSVEHRGISFSVVEMSFPCGWKWTVGKAKTVTVGVCATKLDAIRQAQTFIDAVIDWAA